MDADQQAGPSDDHTPSLKGKKRAHEDICVICLDTISERAIAVPCNHCDFDFICLVSWLQDHPQCPLCTFTLDAHRKDELTVFAGKASLTAVEYDWRAPDDYKTFLVPSLATSLDGSNSDPTSSSRSHCTRSAYRGRHRRHTVRTSTAESRESGAILKRRHVYRRQLYSLHVGSNPQSRFRDITPAIFAQSSQLESRARMWIRRELQVFDFLGPTSEPVDRPRSTTSNSNARGRRKVENSEFLLSYIVSILATVDIKSSSGAAQALLADFLGEENAALFLHELSHWLRSPYTQLDNWDRHVQYAEKLPEFGLANQQCLVDARNIPWGGFGVQAPAASSSQR